MKPLKIGITGVRGIVGETFTPELVVEFAQAFGTYLDGGLILLSRDPRPSGPMVRAAVAAGLLATGCEVMDLSICPTPTMQLAVRHFNARGGISITAGHNPSQWNALKFVRGDGLYLNATQAEELLDLFHQGEFHKAKWRDVPRAIETRDALAFHIETLKQAFDVDAIRAAGLRVAVDCCNGASARLVPPLLEELGCTVLAINDDIGLPFPHNPEPRRETMAQLRAVVKAGRAHVGFAHDADGERIGIVTEAAEALSEEMTLAIAAEIKLRQTPGTVVTNVSTTSAIEAIANRHHSSIIRTQVGTAYISEAILEYQAVLGGEGNGAVAIPDIIATNDSAAAIVLILEAMAKTGKRISEIAAGLPQYTMRKHNVQVAPNLLFSVLNDVRKEAEGAGADEVYLGDGVKLIWPDGWLHVRASNTESMIRVIAESEHEDRAQQLLNWAIDRLK
jgi:phosphomannomutase